MNDYLIYTVTHNDILYTGMMYHERKEVCHWKTMYTVVRDLDVLIEGMHNIIIIIIKSLIVCGE